MAPGLAVEEFFDRPVQELPYPLLDTMGLIKAYANAVSAVSTKRHPVVERTLIQSALI